MDFFKFAVSQNLPSGSLFLVPTPIGNLADITIRALHVLQQVDGIACEDKRHSGMLLNAYGISKPLHAIHDHNEISASAYVIEKLKEGQRWAYVSDAGTPGISDPGALLTQEVREAGLPVIPLPGPSAITTAISASGDFLKNSEGGFQFLGFLPNKATQRDNAIKKAINSHVASFFYEAPHRVEATLRAISEFVADDRHILIAKELSKIFEVISVVHASELSDWISSIDSWQGEYVLGIEGAPQNEKISQLDETTLQWVALLENQIGHKDLSEIVSKITGLPKKEAYKELLAHKK